MHYDSLSPSDRAMMDWLLSKPALTDYLFASNGLTYQDARRVMLRIYAVLTGRYMQEDIVRCEALFIRMCKESPAETFCASVPTAGETWIILLTIAELADRVPSAKAPELFRRIVVYLGDRRTELMRRFVNRPIAPWTIPTILDVDPELVSVMHNPPTDDASVGYSPYHRTDMLRHRVAIGHFQRFYIDNGAWSNEDCVEVSKYLDRILTSYGVPPVSKLEDRPQVVTKSIMALLDKINFVSYDPVKNWYRL